MMKQKAQTSMEFLLISSLVFFVLVLVLPLLSQKVIEAMQEDDKSLLKEQAEIMKAHIDTAMQVKDGFYDNFSLQPGLDGRKYIIYNRNYKKLGFSYSDDDYEYLINLPNGSNVSWPTGEYTLSYNFIILNEGSGITLINLSS